MGEKVVNVVRCPTADHLSHDIMVTLINPRLHSVCLSQEESEKACFKQATTETRHRFTYLDVSLCVHLHQASSLSRRLMFATD